METPFQISQRQQINFAQELDSTPKHANETFLSPKYNSKGESKLDTSNLHSKKKGSEPSEQLTEEENKKNFLDIQNQKEIKKTDKPQEFQSINQKLKFRTFFFYFFIFVAMFLIKMLYMNKLLDHSNNYSEQETIHYQKDDFAIQQAFFLNDIDTILIQTIKTTKHISKITENILRKSNLQEKEGNTCQISDIPRCLESDQESIYKSRAQPYYKETDIYFSTSTYKLISQKTDELFELVKLTNHIQPFLYQFMGYFSFERAVHSKLVFAFTKTNYQFIREFPSIVNNDLTVQTEKYIQELDQKNDQNWVFQQIENQKIVNIYPEYMIISQKILDFNRENSLGVIGAYISFENLQKILERVIGDTSAVFIFDLTGKIILSQNNANPEINVNQNLFEQLSDCICQQIKTSIQKYGDISCSGKETQEVKDDETICEYFAFKAILEEYQTNLFAIVLDNDGNNQQNNDFAQIISVLWVYFSFFVISILQAFYTTSTRINNFTRDITNPIKQISFKMHRIMKNMYNVKVFQKIQADDIVIKEETEIRNFAYHFGLMYKKLQQKGLFSHDFSLILDSSQNTKSKDIQKKSTYPEKFLEEVQEIHDKFIKENLDELEINYFQSKNNSHSISPSPSKMLQNSAIQD